MVVMDERHLCSASEAGARPRNSRTDDEDRTALDEQTSPQNQTHDQNQISHIASRTTHSMSQPTGNTLSVNKRSKNLSVTFQEYTESLKYPDQGEACSLQRNVSTSTAKSNDSHATIKSNKSVQSLPALGAYPLGSLRLHSDNADKGDPVHSQQCLTSGDVLIISGLSSGSFFGCDTMALNVEPGGEFCGVRDIPPGAHFVYGGSSSMESMRNGFWIMSNKRTSADNGEIHVKRWDKYTETLQEEVSLAETRIQQEGVPAIFDKLMTYASRPCVSETSSADPKLDLESLSESTSKDNILWLRLTSAIKGATLTRITGHEWNRWSVTSSDDHKPMAYKPIDSREDSRDKEACDRLDQLTAKDRVLTFAFPQNATTFSNSVTGRQRTEQAMDTSAHIMAVIAHRCNYEDEDEVIGELQFCFLTGMILGNVACMEQWAWLVKVIFRAFKLAMDKPEFFRKMVEAVHAQLIYNEEGLEGSIFDHDSSLENELKMLLTIFKSRLNEQLLAKGSALSDGQKQVGMTFERLESWLWKWGWDLRGNYLRSGKIQLEDGEIVDAEMDDFQDEDERGEFAPVVVDIDEHGKEKGLLRW